MSESTHERPHNIHDNQVHYIQVGCSLETSSAKNHYYKNNKTELNMVDLKQKIAFKLFKLNATHHFADSIAAPKRWIQNRFDHKYVLFF